MNEGKSSFDRHGRARAAGLPRRGFRSRRLALADGGRLDLRVDGTITAFAPDGTVSGTWPMGAEGWPEQAFRFGIRSQEPTTRPDGRVIDDAKPG